MVDSAGAWIPRWVRTQAIVSVVICAFGGEFSADCGDVFDGRVGGFVGCGSWRGGLWQHRIRSAGVVALDEGVDPLPGAFEVAGCLAHAHMLFSDGFNDREVGVVVAHGQLLLAECVNYVATDLSTIIAAGWRVSDCLCAGAWFTSNPRIGQGKPRLVG